MRRQAPLYLLTLSLAAVGIQALMLSPLLTDIAGGLGSSAKEVGFAAGAYDAGMAPAVPGADCQAPPVSWGLCHAIHHLGKNLNL